MATQQNSIARQAALKTNLVLESLISKVQSHPSENDNNYNQLLKELTTFQTSVDSLSALLPLIKMNLDDNLPTPLTWYSSICTGLTQQIQDVEKSSESLDWSALKCNGRTIPEMIKAMRDPHNTVDLLVTASLAIMIPVTPEEKAPILRVIAKLMFPRL